MKHLGNGEGFTTLVLTGEESLIVRAFLEWEVMAKPEWPQAKLALAAFNRGIQRAAERIAAEFKLEQKARKALKSDQAATVQKGKT